MEKLLFYTKARLSGKTITSISGSLGLTVCRSLSLFTDTSSVHFTRTYPPSLLLRRRLLNGLKVRPGDVCRVDYGWSHANHSVHMNTEKGNNTH